MGPLRVFMSLTSSTLGERATRTRVGRLSRIGFTLLLTETNFPPAQSLENIEKNELTIIRAYFKNEKEIRQGTLPAHPRRTLVSRPFFYESLWKLTSDVHGNHLIHQSGRFCPRFLSNIGSQTGRLSSNTTAWSVQPHQCVVAAAEAY